MSHHCDCSLVSSAIHLRQETKIWQYAMSDDEPHLINHLAFIPFFPFFYDYYLKFLTYCVVFVQTFESCHGCPYTFATHKQNIKWPASQSYSYA